MTAWCYELHRLSNWSIKCTSNSTTWINHKQFSTMRCHTQTDLIVVQFGLHPHFFYKKCFVSLKHAFVSDNWKLTTHSIEHLPTMVANIHHQSTNTINPYLTTFIMPRPEHRQSHDHFPNKRPLRLLTCPSAPSSPWSLNEEITVDFIFNEQANAPHSVLLHNPTIMDDPAIIFKKMASYFIITQVLVW